MNPAIRVSMGVGVALIGYTGAVIQHTLQHRQACRAMPEFSAGSADTILKESLRAGDVIMFSRRWYNYHAPEALAIKLYQLIHDTPYDHIGVIVTDKYGEPYIFEQTFFHGYRIRPFETRILYSRANQITAMMLMPRCEEDTAIAAKRTAKLDNFVSKSIAKNGSVSGWYSGVKSFFSPSSPCSNLQLLIEVYRCLDMDLVADVEKKGNQEGKEKEKEKTGMNCKSLLKRQICIHEKEEKSKSAPSSSRGRYFSHSDVLVRTT